MSVTGEAINTNLLKRVFAYINPYKKVFYSALILTILLAIIAPVRPYLIQYTIDHSITDGNVSGLINMILIMTVLLIFQGILQFYHTYTTNWLGQSAINDLRQQVFNHLMDMRVRFFDRTPIGTLVTRTVSDIEVIADIFSEGLIVIVGDILQIVTIIGVMLYVDWRLTLISLSVMPLLMIATYVFKEKTKKAFQEVRTEVSRINTFLQEHITGMKIVQIFAREKQEMENFKKINRLHRDAHIRSVLYYSVFFPVVEIIAAASIGLMVYYGAIGVISDRFSVGVLVSFILYINMLYRPLRELADKFNTLQMGMVSSERIFKVLDTDDSTPNTGTIKEVEIKGKIEFRNVWFAYTDEDWVLKGISFTIMPGQTLALVGATGSGKTTIINLLNRFYDKTKGEILIDDIPVEEYELGYLRSAIATIMQDVFLFSDSVAENMRLRNQLINDQELENSATEVGALSFIDKLPGRLNFEVMERGSSISAGQAQLLSFTRALVYNPKILILDEATSSVDSETEMMIQQATDTLMKGRTAVIVAHRLSTIQHADKIIVMQKGEIMEEGNHQELLKKGGIYKGLYEIQFSK